MFKKLLVYNWKVFRHSLTGTKIFVLVLYGLILAFLFAQVISTVFVIVTLQETALSKMFAWYTPERGQLILLGFANVLWLSQFFFTNVRLMKIEENRKLLTLGYPAHQLSRYLTILTFFHPINLLFNITWFVLLMLQFGSAQFVPIAAIVVLTNFSLIFSVKFRIMTVIKSYQKWILVLGLTVLAMVGISANYLFSDTFFTSFEQHIPAINQAIALLPGGLIATAHSILYPLAVQLPLIVVCGALCFWLHRDHVFNTRRALQTRSRQQSHQLKTGPLRSWLCSVFGNHGGKYLYYVFSHPYNKIQGLFFLGFPLVYLPLMLGEMGNSGDHQFLILFIFIYAPLGFQLMFLGNMFGYEHREMLKELQFPVLTKNQLKQRILGALIIPAVLLVMVIIVEIFLLDSITQIATALLGNILLFELFLAIFLWSSFNRFEKVQWVSFSFTQPVISQSVAFTISLLMLVMGAAVFISYGAYEIYKQSIMLLVIGVGGFAIYRYIDNIEQKFSSKIIPELWTER